MNFQLREKNLADKIWLTAYLYANWGSATMVTRGRIYQASDLPGFVAESDAKPTGIILYHLSDNQCEITLLESFIERVGIGTALLDAVKHIALRQNCTRLWLITTNDNLAAIRYYQRRDFTLAALYPNAIAWSRKLKPEIAWFGIDQIPIRDEIELELKLSDL